MKNRRQETAKGRGGASAAGGGDPNRSACVEAAREGWSAIPWWAVTAAALFLLFVAFEIYGPALHGPFIFDDPYLPFASPDFADLPVQEVLKTQRPLLMLSFWLQVRAFGADPYSLHLVNVMLHVAASLLAWLIVRRLSLFSGHHGWKREWIAAFAGAVFLLHPLQTESAAYIASRSETQSVLFLYAALALFLYCGPPLPSFTKAFLVLLLFAPAVLTKEHAAILPAVLLLTDYYWNPGFSLNGIRRNWRLYLPMALGALAAGGFVWNVLRQADTAGFSVKGVTWYQYLFTQFKVIWVYLRLFLFPAGQNIDWDYPISRSLFEPLTLLAFLAWAAAVTAAVVYRRRYPLASFGFFAFLFLLAPTSSVVPIKDALAERRMYLPMVGLLCLVADLLWRWKASKQAMAAAMAAVLLVFSFATWKRNHLWADSVALWENSVSGNPRNARAEFQLAFALFENNRCSEAVAHFERSAKLAPIEPRLLVDWALALDCASRPGEALSKLLEAAAVQPTAHVWSLVGMVHAKQGRRGEAMEALEKAIGMEPDYDMSYVYRGNLRALDGDWPRAAIDYRAALARNPSNSAAREGLTDALKRLKERH